MGARWTKRMELASTGEARKVRYMDYHPRLNIRSSQSSLQSRVTWRGRNSTTHTVQEGG